PTSAWSRGVRTNGSQPRNRQAFAQVILSMSLSSAPAAVSSASACSGTSGQKQSECGVVALPGDDVDADLVPQLQRRLVGYVAGQRVLTKHIAGQLVAEVAAQPLL